MYVCIVHRSGSTGGKRGRSLASPGINMRGHLLYDGVFMYKDILDDRQATRLYGKLMSLQYDGIQNPDARRFQSE